MPAAHPPSTPDRLVLTNQEFAALLGVSKRTFHNWKRAGVFNGLEAPIPLRYSRARVIAWIDGRRLGRVS
jgi:predicted DNA-binding transcriptional regulator AlpA